MLSSSRDGTVQLWDAATGMPIGETMHLWDSASRMHVVGGNPTSAVTIFSPDGSRIVTTVNTWKSYKYDAGSAKGGMHPPESPWAIRCGFMPP